MDFLKLLRYSSSRGVHTVGLGRRIIKKRLQGLSVTESPDKQSRYIIYLLHKRKQPTQVLYASA